MGALKLAFFALVKLLLGIGSTQIPKVGWIITIVLWGWMAMDIMSVINYVGCDGGANECLHHLN